MELTESLITLLRVAQEDQEVLDQLSYILSLDSFHRKSALHSLIDSMHLNGAPDEIVAAISGLLEDHIADQAKLILDPKN